MMRKKDIYTLAILILLTVSTAILSNNSNNFKYIIFFILSLSGIKFILVAFQFMELKKAHQFWKSLIVIFLILFIGTISLIL